MLLYSEMHRLERLSAGNKGSLQSMKLSVAATQCVELGQDTIRNK